MGLDMYAWKIPAEVATNPINVPIGDILEAAYERHKGSPDAWQKSKDPYELFYWRKHPNLHGWMQVLFVKKGGDADPGEFNGFNTSVQLTAEDLDRLEKATRSRRLPETEGFFFGKSFPEDDVRTLEFITKARQALADGFAVYYSSSW